MKQNLLTLCLAISCFFAFAQSKNSNNLNTNTKSIYSSVSSPIISSSAAAAPPFWSNDFSNASDWTMVDLLNGGLQNWVITTNGPQGGFSNAMGPIASTTAANGFALYDSDALNSQYVPQQATLTYNGTVDCSQYQYVNINFECHHRVFRDSVFVEISLDNFQTIAGRYRFHEEIALNNSSANPDFVSVNVSSSAGNQSNVYFRFMYEGEWDYAIMIDDVSFSETPNNEIKFDGETFGGWWIAYATSGGYGSDFTFNPLDQLTAMPYRFEGSIANTGVMTQNNVVMHVDVEDAQGMMLSNHASSPISLTMGAADTVATTTNFTPTSYGIHNFNFYASSDSFPTTDTVTRSAIVTDTVYGVDFDWNSDGANAGGGYFLGRSCGGQVLGNAFDIFAPTYATSITFFVDDESVVGAEVTAQLYEVDPSQSIANAPPLLLNESDPYTLTGPDIGNWKTLKLQSTAPISLFPGSSYLAAVKGSQHPLDTSMISSNNNPNSASYLQNNCPDANGNVGNWGGLSSAPMIRLNVSATAPPTGVKDIYHNGISVYPNPSGGEISIDIADFNAYYLSVKDILGKEVYSEKIKDSKFKINLTHLEKGVYLIELNNNLNKFSKEIIIQ